MEGVKKLLLVLLYGALITVEVVLATDHVVGGSSGWDESTDFSSWASGETFKFSVIQQCSVVEHDNESAYKSCDIGSAVDFMNGGNSVVKLDKAGTRYFACGTMGHCGQGMKVNITTVSANAAGPTSTSTSSSSSPTGSTSTTPYSHSSSTPTSTSAASNFHHFVSFISLATLMIFALLFTIV